MAVGRLFRRFAFVVRVLGVLGMLVIAGRFAGRLAARMLAGFVMMMVFGLMLLLAALIAAGLLVVRLEY